MSQFFTISRFLSNKGLNIIDYPGYYKAVYNNSGWSIPTTLGMVTQIILPLLANSPSLYAASAVRYLLVFSGELIGVIAGTKNVAKQLRHICAGTVRTRDRTWFTELSDKGMCFLDILIKNGISGYSARCTKVHLYWCMRNGGGNPDRLRAMIMNISKYFQVCIYIVGVCACVCDCVCECV